MTRLLTNTAGFACRKCLEEITKHGKACPYMSLGNEFCEEVEQLDRAASELECKTYKMVKEAEG